MRVGKEKGLELGELMDWRDARVAMSAVNNALIL
jgi:hypothetical protein